jgi:hypothetical protein
MLTSSHNFGLVSFGQDAVPAATYAQVEKVYIESMGLTARTNTNEIVYWRDRYNMRHDRGDRISAGTMLALLECLLFDLYLRWYTPHSKDLKGFRRQLNSLFAMYREELSKDGYVTLNGSVHPNTTLPIIAKPSGVARTTPSTVLTPVLLLVVLLPVSASLLALSYWLGASTLSVLIVFLVALFACLVLLAVWHKPAGQQADKVLKLLATLLRKQKDIR